MEKHTYSKPAIMEKTFQFEDTLPNLPIADLEKGLEVYLQSVKAGEFCFIET